MILQPTDAEKLTISLASAHKRGEKISCVDLSALNRLLEHKAEDMTATVQAGMSLADLQKELARRGQWLPIDPPNPERLSLGALLATNASGPRRFGYGTVRDYLIGIAVVLADGRLIHSGGKVVKNVAGYDVMKLFVGSQGSLGLIVEATFKVLPIPQTEQFVAAKCDSLEQADQLIQIILDSDLRPVVLDLHNLSSSAKLFSLVVGFAGTPEDVEWQLSKAAELGITESGSLDYENTFFARGVSIVKTSVLPSRIFELIRSLDDSPFVARAGNGIVYERGPSRAPSPPGRPIKLERRLKQEFDSQGILPVLAT